MRNVRSDLFDSQTIREESCLILLVIDSLPTLFIQATDCVAFAIPLSIPTLSFMFVMNAIMVLCKDGVSFVAILV